MKLVNITDVNRNKMKDQQLLFFIFFSISLWFLFPSHTLALWRFNSLLMTFLYFITIILSIIVLVRSIPKYASHTRILISSVLILVLINVFFVLWYDACQLWLWFVLVVGAKNIEFKKIVKCHFFVEICLCLSNITAYYLGFINHAFEFLQDERVAKGLVEGSITRLSLGYPAAGDFATHLLYILIDLWILRKGLFKSADYFCSLFLLYIVTFLSDARQAGACIVLLLLCSLLYKYRLMRKSGVNFFSRFLLINSIPIFFSVTVIVTMLYDDTDINWLALNFALSGRLQFGLDAIQKYGISFWGQEIYFAGGGFADVGNEYNYVDSGYLQELLLWGVLVMAVLICSFVKIGKQAYKRCDFVYLLSLLIAGVSTITTQFLFFPNYCILLVALTAKHNNIEPRRILPFTRM